MTSTCHPTPSMCWQQWPLFNKIRKIAPNHRSRLIRLQSQRPQWTWARLKVGRRHILPETITPSICLKRSLDGSTGTFRRAKHLTLRSRDEYRLAQAHPPHRPLHHDKREDRAWGCLFLKKWSVAAHLRGMRPTLTNEKNTLMLRRNSNIIYFLLNFKL